MKLRIALVSAAAALSIWGGTAFAAGPSGNSGPWIPCPNNNPICAGQLGADLNPLNQIFDCLTTNGRAGHALQSSNTGTARCWAN